MDKHLRISLKRIEQRKGFGYRTLHMSRIETRLHILRIMTRAEAPWLPGLQMCRLSLREEGPVSCVALSTAWLGIWAVLALSLETKPDVHHLHFRKTSM